MIPNERKLLNVLIVICFMPTFVLMLFVSLPIQLFIWFFNQKSFGNTQPYVTLFRFYNDIFNY